MDKKAYWLWLREALGAGAVTDEITAVFPSPEEMYSRGEIEWRLSGVLTNRQIEKLKQCSPEKAQGIVDGRALLMFVIITVGPSSLRTTRTIRRSSEVCATCRWRSSSGAT